MERKETYFAATTVAVLFWSASFIATKIAYTIFEPLMVGFIRFFLAAIILFLVRLIRRDTEKPKKEDLKTIALSGLLGNTLYFAAENLGVQYTSASNASLIVASYPAITTLFEFLIYRMKPGGKKIVGILLAFVGIGILTVTQENISNPNALFGNAILIVAGIVWTFYNFITRSIVGNYSPVTLSTYQMMFGAIFFVPLVWLEGGEVGTLTVSAILAIAYLACGCSVAAFLLYNYGLRKLSAAVSISLTNLIPVFGIVFSAVLLHETITFRQVIGGLVVILGVILSSHGKKNEE